MTESISTDLAREHDAIAAAAAEHGVRPPPATEPYYLPTSNEIEVFSVCHARGLPAMLKGPTGCGKSRFVEHMAWRLGRPLVTIACHEDLTASDLTGRYLIRGGETLWVDGPLTVAARIGAICYLDEIVEARQDTVVVIHPLTDDRRILPLDKTGELVSAAPGFQLVISYNPGYQHATKDLKPSTRQRFVTLEFDFPPPALEAEIVMHEGGVEKRTARELVELARKIRALRDQGLAEAPGTRLLVSTARLIASGVAADEACAVALVGPLTDDPDLVAAISDLVAATL
ncbi:MAG TPA: CbbQ/NirQ/NorQ/GpvN family protein [Gemmatimonadaceae bacterium]|nr:CbbQ/NirQ/NorQ/GpvN family protein [Gemmatimonadaceae bacterium]